MTLFTWHPKDKTDCRVARKSLNLQCCAAAIVRKIPFRVFSSTNESGSIIGRDTTKSNADDSSDRGRLRKRNLKYVKALAVAVAA